MKYVVIWSEKSSKNGLNIVKNLLRGPYHKNWVKKLPLEKTRILFTQKPYHKKYSGKWPLLNFEIKLYLIYPVYPVYLPKKLPG